MKFLHMSDTHLGYNQYGLTERGADFYDVFEEAVDIAIENKVDFVIHTGDFFHTSRPSNQTILQAINLTNKLKTYNIPIFAISGNHDRGSQVRDISPLKILENFGLKLVDTKSMEHKGVLISGVKYISKIGLRQQSLRQILELILKKTKRKSDFHILMLHQEFNPYFPNSNLYLQNEIPEGFDYIGIGHYHIPQKPTNINGATVIHAGSTEFTAYNKKEEKYQKGVHLIEINNKEINYEFVPLTKRRPFIYFDIDENQLDTVIAKLKEQIEAANDTNKKLPVLVLKGVLSSLSPKDLISIFEKEGIQNSVLHINYNLYKDSPEIQSEFKKIDLQDEIIYQKLKELIQEEELFNEIFEIMNELKSLESKDEMKKYLKSL